MTDSNTTRSFINNRSTVLIHPLPIPIKKHAYTIDRLSEPSIMRFINYLCRPSARLIESLTTQYMAAASTGSV